MSSDEIETSVSAGTKGGVTNKGGGDDNDIELDPDKRREARKLRRIMANRKSARESRERRKKLLLDLHDTVESLQQDNTSLTKENYVLKNKLGRMIEQAGGIAGLSMIPNIRALYESTQAATALSDPLPSTGANEADSSKN